MTVPPKRTSALRLTLAAVVAAAVVIAGYAFGVEPYWIEVTRHRVVAPIAAPIKIAHLTDVHTDGVGRRERKLLALLEEEKPDAIVVTGDTLAAVPGIDFGRAGKFLGTLRAPLGVWVVRGNWENRRRPPDEKEFYETAGVNFLLNTAAELRPGVWVAGFDDFATGSPDLPAALGPIPPGSFILALYHSPAYFEKVAGRVQLALAGHTHGGQVRIPGLPPLWLPRGAEGYLGGWYEKRGSRMYISRGIGTSILPMRLFCRPELAIINLEPARAGAGGAVGLTSAGQPK